jgi:hypothetical protein
LAGYDACFFFSDTVFLKRVHEYIQQRGQVVHKENNHETFSNIVLPKKIKTIRKYEKVISLVEKGKDSKK